jgi:CxxC motif-containing protein (DUF1111 family)
MRAATLMVGSLVIGFVGWVGEARAEVRARPQKGVAEGESLFLRKWRPDDPKSHGGDGLGPVFNERSCVGCHSLGGPGGGGPSSRNVQILTPILKAADGKKPDAKALAQLAKVVKAQTGFKTAGSVVLHKFGVRPEYSAWRLDLLKRDFYSFTLRRSERNTPALFGSGLIDSIPDAVLEAAAKESMPGFSEVKGRASRLRDGRIGRFGWKGHTATLEDFVLTACSVELGLEVPGHHQSEDLSTRSLRTPEPDLTAAECDALVAYVRGLPAPADRPAASPAEGHDIAEGAALFSAIGCATCHRPKLGDVEGIYSDLLLHDMGPSLSDSAAYYGTDQEITDGPVIAAATRADRTPDQLVPAFGAMSQEWRTPPLWGLRNSAPYLHDGRAFDIDQAIRAHGGQASVPASNYANLLNQTQRKQLLMFLNSLEAPARPSRERRTASRTLPAVPLPVSLGRPSRPIGPAEAFLQPPRAPRSRPIMSGPI